MAEEEETPIPTFKCILIGDAGLAKIMLVERLKNAGFLNSEVNAEGVEVRPVVFYTTRGPLRFDVWDVTGEEKYEELCEGDCVPTDCAIIMFEDADSEHVGLRIAYQNVPVILCGNEDDMKDMSKEKTKFQYIYDIDPRAMFSFVFPFMWIAIQLLGDNELKFTPLPADSKEAKELRLYLEEDMEEAVKTPLPPDDGKW